MSHLNANTNELLELSALQVEAEELWGDYVGRDCTGFLSVWYFLADHLKEPISNDRDKWGRIRFTLDAFQVDPGMTLYSGPELHPKVMQARRYLLQKWKAQRNLTFPVSNK